MEVTTIPDIRERNDRPKDKQPKHQAVSIVQRQMVQRFVKELNDSANQPDRSDSAERTATEQVETTTREIVHEAVQQRIRGFFRKCTAGAICPAAPRAGITARTNRRATHPARCDAAAEHTDTRTAGTGPTCLCPTNRKIGRVSAANHVGAAATAAYHSDRAIGRKCTASAHGRCAHPARTATVTERTATSAAGAGQTCLCPANRKGVHHNKSAGTLDNSRHHAD